MNLGQTEYTCECGRKTTFSNVLKIQDAPLLAVNFRPVEIGEVRYLYGDGAMGFVCSCGVDHSVSDEPVACDCGRLYRVRHYLEVKDSQ